MSALLRADARSIPLPDGSVHCCVTSPPYWGLRDYGTAQWVGGDASCDHKPGNVSRVGRTSLQGGTATAGHQQEGYRDECGKCGAQRVDRQIGLEKTPAEYVSTLVNVFREVRRVLRDDGTLWLNLGDTYASAWPCQRRNVVGSGSLPNGKQEARPPRMPEGLKEKDLVGIPWRVAFALQADGWYLRSDIIWHKPNPMPESVRDRPTKAHEYLFLLTKSPDYYYDYDAIMETSSANNAPGANSRFFQDRDPAHPTDRKQRKAVNARTFRGGGAYVNNRSFDNSAAVERDSHGNTENQTGARNRRTVWTVATRPYSGAHFATFPPALVEPCILAGCPVGGTVLDPFGGSGTVGAVALEHGRKAVLLDLNPAYIELARKRIGAARVPLFATEGAGAW